MRRSRTDTGDRACDDGYAAACSNLGVLQMQARSRPIDRDRALSYFGRACAGGEPHSCLNAVHIMGGEERAEADPVVGALLTAACDGDVATGCFDSLGLDEPTRRRASSHEGPRRQGVPARLSRSVRAVGDDQRDLVSAFQSNDRNPNGGHAS